MTHRPWQPCSAPGFAKPTHLAEDSENADLEISAKTDYAVRALLELAANAPDPLQTGGIVGDQQLPRRFVEAILRDLRRAGIVRLMRGPHGGYTLARAASEVSIGSVIRAVNGPLVEVRGLPPDEINYTGLAAHLPDIWLAVRASLHRVLDDTSLEQVLTGELPAHVRKLLNDPDAYARRTL